MLWNGHREIDRVRERMRERERERRKENEREREGEERRMREKERHVFYKRYNNSLVLLPLFFLNSK